MRDVNSCIVRMNMIFSTPPAGTRGPSLDEVSITHRYNLKGSMGSAAGQERANVTLPGRSRDETATEKSTYMGVCVLQAAQ